MHITPVVNYNCKTHPAFLAINVKTFAKSAAAKISNYNENKSLANTIRAGIVMTGAYLTAYRSAQHPGNAPKIKNTTVVSPNTIQETRSPLEADQNSFWQ